MEPIRIEDYPELKRLAWNRLDAVIATEEAFALYERNWRFVDQNRLNASETHLIHELARLFGHGFINA